MKPVYRIVGVLLVVGGGVLGWRMLADRPDAAMPMTPAASAPPVPLPSAKTDWPAVASSPASQDSPLLPLDRPELAAHTLAAAREQGDSRSPPILRSEALPGPTEAELADPKQYAQYETRQHERLVSNYIKAANQALPGLRKDIARARAEGMAEADIAVGIEKSRRIAAMQKELMEKYPHLVTRDD